MGVATWTCVSWTWYQLSWSASAIARRIGLVPSSPTEREALDRRSTQYCLKRYSRPTEPPLAGGVEDIVTHSSVIYHHCSITQLFLSFICPLSIDSAADYRPVRPHSRAALF